MTASILLFFNLSGGEILVILGVAFLIFGPSRFPEIGRKLGRFLRDAKNATREITKEFEAESSMVKNEIKEIKSSINSVNKDITEIDKSSNTKR